MGSVAFGALMVFGALAGLRAWSTHHPDPVPPDPTAPYEIVIGAVKVAWQQMYDRPGEVRAISQTAPGYWELTIQDSQGCWAQVVAVVDGFPAIGGERTPSPCPPVQKAASGHGDALDPTKSPPADAAIDFTEAWLEQGNYSIFVAPGATVAPLGRSIETTDVTAYALSGDAITALLWVTANAPDGPLGLRVALTNDHGRWFVTGVRGGPAVTSTLGALPDPTTTTTASPTTTSTTPVK